MAMVEEIEASQHVLFSGLNSVTNKAKHAAEECVTTAENKVGQNCGCKLKSSI